MIISSQSNKDISFHVLDCLFWGVLLYFLIDSAGQIPISLAHVPRGEKPIDFVTLTL
jgi:hypothetical protein